MNKALVCKTPKGFSGLTMENIPVRLLNDDEVEIEIAACGLNFPDILIIQNKYQFKPELPFIPGGEFSGIVLQVGKNAKKFKPGQRVFAIARTGGLAQKAILNEKNLFALPDSINFKEAASLLYNLSTAYYALKNIGKAKVGNTLLVLGASGGVGLAAIQLGKAMGLRVIAAAGSKEKLNYCKQYGADYLINYHEEDLKDKAKVYSADAGGVDIVLDNVGAEFSEPALRTLSRGGRYLVVGFAGGDIPKIPLNLVLLKEAEIKGVFWSKFIEKEPEKQQENLEELFEYIQTGKIKTYISREYPLEKSVQALKDFKQKDFPGKYLIICNEELLSLPTQRHESPKKIFNSKKEIIDRQGEIIGISRGYQITQKDVDDFAHLSQDPQWIHLDKKKAAMSPLGSTVAHGYFILSLSTKFLNEILDLPFVQVGFNYGLDKVRFISPVPVGSTIRMQARLLSAEIAENGGLKIKIEALFFLNGKEDPVCYAELLSMIY